MTIHDDAPADFPAQQVPLSPEQSDWLASAVAQIDEERMRRFDLAITAIHSPTGEERELAEWLVEHMAGLGLDASYQAVDDRSGNAVGRHAGAGGGPSLLLYAPLDTHLRADPAEDVPWVGPELRLDMVPTPYVAHNGDVIGLGSANPKGMITALTEAVRAVTAAGVPLRGGLVLAFAGGGMPWLPRGPAGHGLGTGVTHMLTGGAEGGGGGGVTADYAIICKPGWAVAWEEVGLCWFKVTVKGQLGYAGMTHTFPGFRNANVHAATFIQALEAWLPEYQARNTSGLCSPQGAIAAVRSGWPDKPAFTSAAAEVYVDLRINPRTTPEDVRDQFAGAIAAIGAEHPEIDLAWEMYAAYPGAVTDPASWVVQACMRGWEYVEGTAHHAITGTSGQTDASAIRNAGIPTARLGYPPVPTVPPEWAGFGGLGVVHIPDLAKVTKAIVYAIVDTCTRTRADVGLEG